jgi:hypothetical protein
MSELAYFTMLALPNIGMNADFKALLHKCSTLIIVVSAKMYYAQCRSDKCHGTAKIVLNKKCYCILITMVVEKRTFKVSFEITSSISIQHKSISSNK